MPLISIILPTYNNEDTVQDSIKSVLRQTFSDYELIVCDDGSTDNTAKVMESFSSNPKIKYVKIEHTGEPAKVRNMAAKHIQGKYIAFIDSDDIWLDDKLENDIAFYKKHPELGYVFCDTADYLGDTFEEENYDGTWVHKFQTLNKIKKFPDVIIFQEKDDYIFSSALLEFALNWSLSSTPAMMTLREIFEEMQGYDESYKTSQDHDLMLRILKKYPIGYYDKPLVKRRRRKDSITTSNIEKFCIHSIKIMTGHMPEKKDYLSKEEYSYSKELLSSYYSLLAYDLFLKNRFSQAKLNFQKHLGCHFSLKSFIYYTICCLPDSVIIYLRDLKESSHNTLR